MRSYEQPQDRVFNFLQKQTCQDYQVDEYQSVLNQDQLRRAAELYSAVKDQTCLYVGRYDQAMYIEQKVERFGQKIVNDLRCVVQSFEPVMDFQYIRFTLVKPIG